MYHRSETMYHRSETGHHRCGTRIRWTAAFWAALIMLASACGASGPDATSGSAPPATTATRSPTTTPVDRPEQVRAAVDAAGLDLADLGVKKAQREDTTISLTMPCGARAQTPPLAAHYWSYTGAKIDILSHSVYGFHPRSGRSVIDELRAALRTCATWTWANTFTMKVVGEFAVAKPAGADAAAGYCHQGTVISGTGVGNRVFICDALVSRAGFVTKVDTVKITLVAAQKEVRKAVPLAAAALAEAVPGT